MMNKSNPFRHLTVAGFACLLAASCSDVTDDSTTLPNGTYPMTFTASVDGLTNTRATTDADGKTSWQENDPVAIRVWTVARTIKEYKISDANTGAMVPNNNGSTLYWSKRQETLAAWHPVSCTIGSNTGGSKVDITDQNTSFGTLENILHAPAQEYTYSSGGSIAFTFRHALAKVKVTLQKGEGIEDNDLSTAATVTFTGYTAGSLGYNGMTGNDGSNGDIPPKTETANDATSYTALVIPQQMQNKKFIKVTIGVDGAARDYFYTPANDSDADLEAGKQYTYTITVKKTGLEVMVTGNGTSWEDNTVPATPDDVVTFHITAPTTGVTIAKTESAATLTDNGAGSYTLSGGNAITVTVDASSQSDKFLKGLSAKGIYDITSGSYTSGSYTYTYILKSDLSFSNPVFVNKTTPAVGDFYYSDGTWSAELWDKPCIGIVFKAGAGKDDEISNYNNLTGSINGYAVAVQDAARFSIRWSNVEENCKTSTATDDYKGYYNTVKVLGIIDYSPEKYPIFGTVSDFGETTVAPSGTSGWYLPSAGQMVDIVNSWKNNGTIWQKLDALPYSYHWKIPTTEHGYATSTEDPANASRNVCRIHSSGGIAKEQKDYWSGNFAVRPVLTF